MARVAVRGPGKRREGWREASAKEGAAGGRRRGASTRRPHGAGTVFPTGTRGRRADGSEAASPRSPRRPAAPRPPARRAASLTPPVGLGLDDLADAAGAHAVLGRQLHLVPCAAPEAVQLEGPLAGADEHVLPLLAVVHRVLQHEACGREPRLRARCWPGPGIAGAAPGQGALLTGRGWCTLQAA